MRTTNGCVNTPQAMRALLAHIDGRPVAVGTVMLEDGLAGVFSMATAPEMRGRGVASALLARLLLWAWEHGAAHAYLQVDSQNHPALGVYRKFGFVTAYTYHYCGRPAEIAMKSDDIERLATAAGRTPRRSATRMCATAESCTGGLVAGAITDIAGSSGWFERGFVTYTNEAKMEAPGRAGGDAARARRGVGGHGAGDGGGRAGAQPGAARGRGHGRSPGRAAAPPDKPVGLVCFAWAYKGRPTTSSTRHFAGDRAEVRRASVVAALQGMLDRPPSRLTAIIRSA